MVYDLMFVFLLFIMDITINLYLYIITVYSGINFNIKLITKLINPIIKLIIHYYIVNPK